jgi:hypothetical protein
MDAQGVQPPLPPRRGSTRSYHLRIQLQAAYLHDLATNRFASGIAPVHSEGARDAFGGEMVHTARRSSARGVYRPVPGGHREADMPEMTLPRTPGGRPAAALLLALSLLLPGAVRAHASPDHADPKVGSTVPAPPSRVRVWFDSDLEPAFFSIAVHGPGGATVRDGG